MKLSVFMYLAALAHLALLLSLARTDIHIATGVILSNVWLIAGILMAKLEKMKNGN